MPREVMTSVGVVDAGICHFIEELNNIPEIKTLNSCSGLSKDHKGRCDRAYVQFSIGKQVDGVEKGISRYPHETDDFTLRIARAILLSGWSFSFGVTTSDNNDMVGCITAKIYPSYPTIVGVVNKDVTGRKDASRDVLEKSNKIYQQEADDYFTVESDEIKIRKWKQLVEEFKFEFIERRYRK